MDAWKLECDAMKTSRMDGLWEGRGIGREEGLKEGLKKGIEEGTAKRNREIAINMLAMGLNIDLVSQATGLSSQEIETIRTHTNCNH